MTQERSIAVLPFDMALLAGQVSPSSKAVYTRDFHAYLAFAGTPATALLPATLAQWRAHLANTRRLSPNTINRMLSAVKRLMEEAAQQHFLSFSVALEFSRVKGVRVAAMKENLRHHNRVKIEPDLIREIVDSFDTHTLVGLRNRAMFMTIASSGLRVNELVTMTHEQLTTRDGGYLIIIPMEQGKNQLEDREANISPGAVLAIREWVQARPVVSPFIFTSFLVRGDSKPSREHITARGAHQVINRVFARHGLPHVKPHDLRRFVGTQLADIDIRMAQMALGHKNIATTAKHYDLRRIKVGVTDNLF